MAGAANVAIRMHIESMRRGVAVDLLVPVKSQAKKQVTFNKIIVPRSRVRVFASHFAGRPSLRGGASSAIAAPASVSSASRRRVIE